MARDFCMARDNCIVIDHCIARDPSIAFLRQITFAFNPATKVTCLYKAKILQRFDSVKCNA